MAVQPDERDGSIGDLSELGHTSGRYLLAIHWLSTADTDRITPSTISRSLDVSAPSVTEMVRKLEAQGLVDNEKYQGVRLTDRGDAVASHIACRVCAVTEFFETRLDTELDDETAYDIGFTLSQDAISSLRERIERPCVAACPGSVDEPARSAG